MVADKADRRFTGAARVDKADELIPQLPRRQGRRSLLKGLCTLLCGSFRHDNLGNNFTGKYSETYTPQEKLMIGNIAELHQARVDDVMITRSDIEAVKTSTTLAETLQVFEKSGHSRMPVYADTLDDPRGMVHIRDVLSYISRSAREGEIGGKLDLSRVNLTKAVDELGVIREVLFVPGSMPASQLLARMQATHTQIALVIDEHGGTDGLVSMEDIVELVVGDIEDEHDNNHVMIISETENSWLVDASTELEEVGKMIGRDFSPGAHAEDVDTIGGLIVSALGRIPTHGEVIEVVSGYRFQVLDADHRRIKRIRMYYVPDNGLQQ